jgi:plastocyanin
MRRSTLIAIIVAIAVIALAAIYFASHQSSSTVTPSPSPSATPSQSTATSASPEASSQSAASATLTYTSSGFSPSSVTISHGGKLTIKNTSSSTIEAFSNPHPQHTSNTELNIGAIVVGGQKTTDALTKTGTFTIHNHLDPSMQATVVVQ